MDVLERDSKLYQNMPIKWFYLPGVGRYNSFELKFQRSWDWLISAIIEMRKYRGVDKPGTKLHTIFTLIQRMQPFDFDIHELWIYVSDYCLELLQQKEIENQKHNGSYLKEK
jgi:hypothetical protein